MKIYFKNKAARLKLSSLFVTCRRCPFNGDLCPCSTATIVDCYCKGWWVDGESLDVFKV